LTPKPEFRIVSAQGVNQRGLPPRIEAGEATPRLLASCEALNLVTIASITPQHGEGLRPSSRGGQAPRPLSFTLHSEGCNLHSAPFPHHSKSITAYPHRESTALKCDTTRSRAKGPK
jgi:hypothetical protein